MALKLITPAVVLPVTVDEAKVHERIDIVDDANDLSILFLLKASTELAQEYTRRAFLQQTWLLTTDNLSPVISIPRPPFFGTNISIPQNPITVKYVDTYNVETLVSPTLYYVDDGYTPSRFVWKGLEVPFFGGALYCGEYSGYYLRIKFVAGYGSTSASVPWEIKEAILQIFGHLYENRESQLIPKGAEQLLRPFKVEYL